jgi:molybdenum cofactor biosynthesis protein B
MVDFQQRDTSRSIGDEDADEAVEDEAEAQETADDTDERQAADHDEATEHDHYAHDEDHLGVGVVTISSTRSRDADPAGDAIQSAVEADDQEVVVRDVVRDDFDGVQNVVDTLVGRSDVDVVVTTGGTGVTPDDVTIEAVRPLFEKELPGFGELFRQLSREDIGTKVVGTRATGGIADGVPVFCLPGSEDAARLGAEEIVVEEAPHLAGLATRR